MDLTQDTNSHENQGKENIIYYIVRISYLEGMHLCIQYI
jgi:hypothetical protein